MSNKKKIIIICSMVVLLVAAAYLNVFISQKTAKNVNTETIEDGSSTTVSFFTSYRTARDSSRQESFMYYDSIIQSETASAAAIASAETKREELVTFAESEMVLEGLIKAKGFEDAIVTISTENVNVIVKKNGEVDATDAAQILSVITEETGVSASKVIITPYSL
ncbi:MAG: SpoIIIAH-like family protein [Clostridia bacterium]|nr:SpoIIIAH-like family protein [Clostridia bacterium]